MNTDQHSDFRFDIHGLGQAIAGCDASDGLRCQFNHTHWELLAGYLQPFALGNGQVLMEQGGLDRTIYFVESGTLSVHSEDEKARVRMAVVGPGSVLGEGAYFAHQPRRATVHAATPCKIWCLTPQRYIDLANRHSAVALELTLAMASVMGRRLYNRPKRVAVT